MAEERRRVRTRRKIRYIQQQTMTECGAACLAMVLDYYGHSIPLSEMRDIVDVGRDGTSLFVMREVAAKFGLEAKGLRVPLEELPSMQLPMVLHWEDNHYVVLEKVTETGAFIVDPARGRRFVELEQLAKSYTGIALACAPGPEFVTRKRVFVWQKYLRLLFMEKKIWIPIVLLSAIMMVLTFGVPVLTGRAITFLLLRNNEGSMSMTLLSFAGYVCAFALVSFLRSRLLTRLQVTIDSRLMQGFVRHMFHLPYVFFQKRSVGDLLMRANTNVLIRDFISSRGVSMLLDGVIAFAFLGLLFWQSWRFALTVVVLVALQVVTLILTWRTMYRLSQEEIATQAASQSYLAETLQGVASVKAAGAEQLFYEQWAEAFTQQLAVIRKRGNLNAYLDGVFGSLEKTAPLVIVMIGIGEVLSGRMSLPMMMNLFFLTQYILPPIKSLLTSIQGFQMLSVYLERLSDVTEDASGTPDGERLSLPLSGEIRVENVSFQYGHYQAMVLKDVSLEIQAGQKVAFVGPSGAGKTTLAKLLVGLYEPTNGRVLYDGHDLKNLDSANLKKQVGVVMQDAFIFGRTIRENIALHDPDMPPDRLVRAAGLAAVHQEIVQMPMAYATKLSERGENLSGGQRQRLALARALAHEPAILLLDEATSDLDTINERTIDQNLSGLKCTRIVIAHRLSTVLNSDKIVVVDQGRIAGVGTHEELMESNELYQSLVSTQLAADDQEIA